MVGGVLFEAHIAYSEVALLIFVTYPLAGYGRSLPHAPSENLEDPMQKETPQDKSGGHELSGKNGFRTASCGRVSASTGSTLAETGFSWRSTAKWLDKLAFHHVMTAGGCDMQTVFCPLPGSLVGTVL